MEYVDQHIFISRKHAENQGKNLRAVRKFYERSYSHLERENYCKIHMRVLTANMQLITWCINQGAESIQYSGGPQPNCFTIYGQCTIPTIYIESQIVYVVIYVQSKVSLWQKEQFHRIYRRYCYIFFSLVNNFKSV